MRATISFETDVGQVEGTMAVLACSEEHNLRAAADLLSDFTVLDGSVVRCNYGSSALGGYVCRTT